METEQNTKSKVVAGLLAFFLGATGAHRYYLGYKKQGAVQTCGFISAIIGAGISVAASGSIRSLYWRIQSFFRILSRYADPARIPYLVHPYNALIVAAPFLIFGAVTTIWAFVDFIRILILIYV